jgi:hypothetical protein
MARRLFSRWWFKASLAVAVAVIVAVAAVVVVEGSHAYRLRNWGPLRGAAGIQFDPNLGWAPVPDYWTPNHGGIRFNTDGLRSPEIRPGVPTVALIGDSVAFGIGLANDQTPSALLGEHLGPYGLQVQNLGVAGYGTDQTLLRLEQKIDLLPDLQWVVLVVCSDNDRPDCRCNYSEGKRKPLFVPEGSEVVPTSVPIAANCARNHLETSPLGRWSWRAFELIRARQWLHNLIGDRCLDDGDLDLVIDGLVISLKDLVEAKGSRFSAVVVPHRDEIHGPPGEAEWWDATLGRLGVETLDFRGFLIDRGLSVEQVYGDPVHMSVEGSHDLAAFLAAQSVWPVREEEGDD